MLTAVTDVTWMRVRSGRVRLAAGTFGLALLPLIVAATTPAAADRQAFAARAETVMVDAVVVDGFGNPVTGLTRDDFVVSEQGRQQHVESFEAVSLPLAPSEAAEVAPPARPRVSTNAEAPQRRARVLAIVFDDVHLSPLNAERAKASLTTFLQQNVRVGETVMLGAVGMDAYWSARMPEGRQDMLAVLGKLAGHRIPSAAHDFVSDYEAMRIHLNNDTTIGDRVERRFRSYLVDSNSQSMTRLAETTRLRVLAGTNEPIVEMRAAETYADARHRNTLTLTGMKRAIEALTTVRGRKSLILVSEGFILDATVVADRDVIDAAKRANVAVYFIDVRGLMALPGFMTAEYNQALDVKDFGGTLANGILDAEGAAAVAESTGGFTIRNSNDLLSGLDRVTRDSRDYYLLGYTPQDAARDGHFRPIQVRVNRKGVTVRARAGYYAPRDDPDAKPDDLSRLDARANAALDSPLAIGDIPLRAAAYVMEAASDGRARVAVTVDADVARLSFAESDGKPKNTLQLVCLVVQRGTGAAQRFDKTVEMTPTPETIERLRASWYPFDHDFELAPGVYQARVMVRDAERRVGTVVHEFDVPDLSGLRISTPILSDVVETPQGQSAAAAAPVARRVFLSDRPLYLQFQVYGAARGKDSEQSSINAGYEIHATDGRVARSSAAKPIVPAADGGLSRLVGIPANVLAPGDYELLIQVWDAISQQGQTAREPFTIRASAATP
jgi:VWFA-related protein